MTRSVAAFLGEISTFARMICAAAVVVCGLPAHAQTTVTFENGKINLSPAQFTQDADTSQRITLSGELRMLGQRVVADACFVQAGIVTQDTLPTLTAAISRVSAIAHALEFGNTSLGIFNAEERRKTLAAIAHFNDLWAPMQANAVTIAQGSGTTDDVALLNDQSAELLRGAHLLFSTIATQYANPAEFRQADAMIINIAGRQQLLAQEMSKNACLASTGIGTENAVDALNTARAAFDNSLGALSAGMPSLGIQAPPTSKIDAGLSAVRSTWIDTQQPIDAQLSGDILDQAQLSAVFYGAQELTSRMNSVIGLYVEASRFDS